MVSGKTWKETHFPFLFPPSPPPLVYITKIECSAAAAAAGGTKKVKRELRCRLHTLQNSLKGISFVRYPCFPPIYTYYYTTYFLPWEMAVWRRDILWVGGGPQYHLSPRSTKGAALSTSICSCSLTYSILHSRVGEGSSTRIELYVLRYYCREIFTRAPTCTHSTYVGRYY